MKAASYPLLVIAGIALTSALIAAEKAGSAPVEQKVLDASNLTWGEPPAGLPPGAQLAVLSGDPTKKGVFTVRLRMPAGYKIPPHAHPTAELVTVISGSCYLGSGEKFDEAVGRKMGAGSFTAIPAEAPHFAWATEESIIQIHGEGPFGIKEVNPAGAASSPKK